MVCLGSATAFATPKSIELNNDGITQHYRGNYGSALELFNESVMADPTSKTVYYNRAATLREMERYDEALADLDKALSLGFEPREVELQKAEVLLDKGDFKTALSTVDHALDMAPDNAFSWNVRGLIHLRLRQFPDAVKDFNKAVGLGATDPGLLVNRSQALRYNGQLEDALADLTEAIRQDPESALARLERIRAYQDLKQPEKALADYQVLLANEPGNAGYLISRGRLLLDLKLYDKAVADFTRAQTLKSPVAPMMIGWARRSQKLDGLLKFTTQLPGKGEIQLDGRVLTVLKDRFVLSATAFTNEAGHIRALSPAKSKNVLLSQKTLWLNSGQGAVSGAALQPGLKLSVIGRDADGLQARQIFVTLNTVPPPAVPEKAVGRPRFYLKKGDTLKVGTAFAARLEDGRAYLVTAHHLLGEAGGLEEDLAPDEVAPALEKVEFFDLPGASLRYAAGSYTRLSPALGHDLDDSRDDVAVFALGDSAKAGETLALSTTPLVPGAAVWIAGKSAAGKGATLDLYPATVLSADEKQLLIRPEPAVQLRALSGAPIVNGAGEAVGMLLASSGDIVICNPATSIAARLKAATPTP